MVSFKFIVVAITSAAFVAAAPLPANTDGSNSLAAREEILGGPIFARDEDADAEALLARLETKLASKGLTDADFAAINDLEEQGGVAPGVGKLIGDLLKDTTVKKPVARDVLE